MRLSKLRIQNFRSFGDETINFDNYTCFVGPNGSGKSTILNALNILFRNNQSASNPTSLSEEDFHSKNTKKPVVITATFTDLSDQAKEDLKAYFRQEQLIFSAKADWNPDTQAAEVKQYGSRMVMKDFAPYFKADSDGAMAAELKKIFKSIRDKFPDINSATSKADMANALRDYEEAHPELCQPLESSDQFYGWSKGANLVEKHCQWVYIPAVKDPTEEQDETKNTALGALLQRTVRSKVDFKDQIDDLRRDTGQKYQELLDAQQKILQDIGNTIEERLHAWAHPGARVNLQWHFDDNKSVAVTEPFARAQIGERDFLGEMVRVGHGMQRSFIVALLQVLASTHEGEQPTLILGFEEPELYQHPPQARHLSSVLEELSDDSQVIVTTHSPYFVSAKGFENVRMTRPSGPAGETRVTQLNYEGLASKLAEAMGNDPSAPSSIMAAVEQIMQPSQNELFFSQIPILVEGPEDIAFISTHMHLNQKWADFRRYGCHFVVCGGKTNMSRPLAIATGLGIPAYVVFDGDCDKATDQENDQQVRDNTCILNLCGDDSKPLQDSPCYKDSMFMWSTRIREDIVTELGKDAWNKAEQNARQEHSLLDGVKQKNPLLITATIENLWRQGIKSDYLDKLCNGILDHAKKFSAI